MSREVAALVYSRRVGSPAKKAVLTYFAEKADARGRGVFPSKASIAAATELGRSTVIRAINDMLADGLIVEVGKRKCVNGATTVYDLDLTVIHTLPKAISDDEPVPERDPMQSQSGTPKLVPERDPSQSGTGGVPERDPMQSQSGTQTVLEPSLNQDADDSAGASDGLTDLEQVAEAVTGNPQGTNGLTGQSLICRSSRHAIDRWRSDLGLSLPEILAVIRDVMGRKRDGPPSSLTYFDGAMRQEVGRKNRPRLVAVGGAVSPQEIDMDAIWARIEGNVQ